MSINVPGNNNDYVKCDSQCSNPEDMKILAIVYAFH